MENNDKQEFIKALKKMGVALRTEVNNEMINVYFKYLQDLSIERVRKGIENCIRELKFFPRVSEIREACPPEVKKVALDYIPTEQERKDNIKNAREVINKLNSGIKTMEVGKL